MMINGRALIFGMFEICDKNFLYLMVLWSSLFCEDFIYLFIFFA